MDDQTTTTSCIEVTAPGSTSRRKFSLADAAMKGVTWLTLSAMFARILSFGVNLVLAWLLLEDDFGMFGLANTLLAFTSVLTKGPIAKILFFRRHRFGLWANAVHWLSIMLGVVAMTLTLLAAFLMVIFADLEDPSRFLMMVGVMALTPLAGSFGVVASAKLRVEMRFREISLIESANLAAVGIGKVGLATAGFGALSFVIPTLIGTVGRTVAYYRLANPGLKWSPEFKKWWYIYGRAILLTATTLLANVKLYGDYAIVSQFVDQKHLGLFYFAFNYAVMGLMMLMTGLADVLLQVFTREKDPLKKFAIYEKSARTACMIIFPACLLQAATAYPIAQFALPERWQTSVLLLQILSLGMPGRVLSWLGVCLIEAQGRFRQRLILNVFSALGFVPLVIAGCLIGKNYALAAGIDQQHGTLVGLALAEAIYFPLNSLFVVFFAVRQETPTPLRSIARIAGLPLAGSAIAVGIAWIIGQYFQSNGLISALVMVAVTLVIYLMFVRTFLLHEWRKLEQRVNAIFQSFIEKRALAISTTES